MKPLLSDLHHPMQPMGFDHGDVIRFKPNRIVEFLLSHVMEIGRIDMTTIRILVEEGVMPVEDLVQFAQLLGYSVSSMGDLGYVPDHILVEIDREADKVWQNRKEG